MFHNLGKPRREIDGGGSHGGGNIIPVSFAEVDIHIALLVEIDARCDETTLDQAAHDITKRAVEIRDDLGERIPEIYDGITVTVLGDVLVRRDTLTIRRQAHGST